MGLAHAGKMQLGLRNERKKKEGLFTGLVDGARCVMTSASE